MLFLNFCFRISVVIEIAKLRFILGIPTGTPMTVANDAIDIPLLLVDKTIND